MYSSTNYSSKSARSAQQTRNKSFEAQGQVDVVKNGSKETKAPTDAAALDLGMLLLWNGKLFRFGKRLLVLWPYSLSAVSRHLTTRSALVIKFYHPLTSGTIVTAVTSMANHNEKTVKSISCSGQVDLCERWLNQTE